MLGKKQEDLLLREPKKYTVNFIEGADLNWDRADHNMDFTCPWNNHTHVNTLFRGLWDQTTLHLRFDVLEEYVKPDHSIAGKLDILQFERVEIFFRVDQRMSPYYCLEVDSLGRILDFQAHYYRRFDSTWCWKGVTATSFELQTGYAVELAVQLQSLANLGLLVNNELEAGWFRAKRNPSLFASPRFEWISWVRPDAPAADFHVRGAFGKLILNTRDGALMRPMKAG